MKGIEWKGEMGLVIFPDPQDGEGPLRDGLSAAYERGAARILRELEAKLAEVEAVEHPDPTVRPRLECEQVIGRREACQAIRALLAKYR